MVKAKDKESSKNMKIDEEHILTGLGLFVFIVIVIALGNILTKYLL